MSTLNLISWNSCDLSDLKVQHLLLDLAGNGGKPSDVILIQESWEFSQQRFQDLDLHVRQRYVFHPCDAFNGVSALVHERWADLVVHVSTKRQYQLLCFELRPDYRVLVVDAHLPDSGSEAANGSLSLHLVGLEAEMNALWIDKPWRQLVFAVRKCPVAAILERPFRDTDGTSGSRLL